MDFNALREQHKEAFEKWVSDSGYVGKDEVAKIVEAETAGLKTNRDLLKSEKLKIKAELEAVKDSGEKVKGIVEVLRKHGLALDDSEDIDYTIIDDALSKKVAPDDMQKKLQQTSLEAQRRARELKQATEELQKIKSELSERDGYINKYHVDDEFKRELIGAGLPMPVVDTILPSLSIISGATVERDAETGERRAVTKDGKPIAEFVSSWRNTDAGKALIQAPANSGGGANTNRKTPSKTVTRSAFESMNHMDRAAAIKDGITVTE